MLGYRNSPGPLLILIKFGELSIMTIHTHLDKSITDISINDLGIPPNDYIELKEGTFRLNEDGSLFLTTINDKERLIRLIRLCNKFKDRVVFYEEDSFYSYANLCWLMAFDLYESESKWESLEGSSLIYEDAGDNAYYDLLGIQVDDEYACIPVPFVVPTIVSAFVKGSNIKDKEVHNRQAPQSDEGLHWEELMSELVFLSLRPARRADNTHFTLRDTKGLGLLDSSKTANLL